MPIFLRCLVLMLVALVSPAFSQEETAPPAAAPPDETKSDETKSGKADPDGPTKSGDLAMPVVKEGIVTTRHEVSIAGDGGARTIAYTATAGYLELPSYEGKPRANIFFIAYIKDDEPEPAARPITFAFNGGPGSSSVWLHMGALGPKRVKMDDEGMPLPPPFEMLDNEYSWLDLTDLVFIDPVSTGFSRPVEGEAAGQFHGLSEDVSAVGEFIRLYVSRHKRWPSPKFLAGESYGTTRAGGLSGYLQDQFGMYLNGLVLISPVIDFAAIDFGGSNDTPYWTFLPTYAATAWYHGKIGPDLRRGGTPEDFRRFLSEVENWASTEYLLALAAGDRLTDEQRDRTAQRLADYSGLSKAFCLNSNLRLEIFQFTKELLRDQQRTVGRLDSRYKGIDAASSGSRPEYDPSYAAILGVYSGTVNDYLRRDLGCENDLVYEILTGRVHPWNYSQFVNGYVSVSDTLRGAMSRNRDLKVFYASGYYDLATPYFAMDYQAAHLGLDPELRGNITSAYYGAGHMMYVRLEDLKKLKADVAKFYAAAVSR
jgi:carboxypeptidase C (cathepsin A)